MSKTTFKGVAMATEQKDGERLAVVEEQIKNLVTAITGLSNDLKNWRKDYVPRQEIQEMFRSRDQDIQEIRDALKGAANKSDIAEIKQTLAEMKNDKRSNKALYAAWAGVSVSLVMAAIAIISLFN
jgi:DNA repair exonuclease SbcCD ATPase subunit